MGTFTENPIWETTVYALDLDDPVLGGAPVESMGEILGGHSNVGMQQVVNRTAYLRDAFANVNNDLIEHEAAADPHPQYVLETALADSVPIKSIATTAPLTKSGTNNITLGIPPATQTLGGFMSAEDKQKLDGLVEASQSGAVVSVNGQTGVVTITKASLSLGNVDNTSDTNKPISTATQTALNGKVSEAPTDGRTYARSNGTWVNVTSEVLVQDLGTVGGTNGQILTLDVSQYTFFSASLSAASTQPTWTLNFNFTNIPDSATKVVSWHVEIINGGKRILNFPSGVIWAGGAAPNFGLTARTVIMFYKLLNRSSIYAQVVDEGAL